MDYDGGWIRFDIVFWVFDLFFDNVLFFELFEIINEDIVKRMCEEY